MISRTVFIIDSIEKSMEAMGMEGKHAALPRESSTQDDDSSSFQGRVRIPLIINHSNIISSIGDSSPPVIAFSSLACVSSWRNVSFSLFVSNLLFFRRIWKYRIVGMMGKRMKEIKVRRNLVMLKAQIFFSYSQNAK